MAQSLGTFPQFKPSEIVSYLKELKCPLPLTLEDINKSNTQSINNIYLWFLACLLQLEMKDVGVACESQMAHLEYPEIYTEAVRLGVLFRTLNQIMIPATIADFSPRDLTAPSKARTVRILSGLINFYLFERQNSDTLYNPLVERTEELMTQETELEGQRMELEQRRRELELIRDQEAKKAEQVEKDNDELRREMQVTQPKAEESTKLNKRLQKEKSILDKKCDEIRLSIENATAEVDRIRSRIIRSPEKAKRSAETGKERLVKLKEDTAMAERMTREETIKLNLINIYIEDLKKCLSVMEEWERVEDTVNEQGLDLGQKKAELQRRMVQKADLDLEIEQLTQRIGIVEAQLANHAKSAEAKLATAQKRMKHLQTVIVETAEEKKNAELQAKAKASEISSMETKIREVAQQAEQEMQKSRDAWGKLEAEVVKYSAKLRHALDALNAYNSQVNVDL